MAWKLCSSLANAKHIFSEGDLIRLRSGTHISGELTLVRLDNKKLQWREEGGRAPLVGWSRDTMTRSCMSEMGAFYGRTIDMFVPEAKPVKPVEDVAPNTQVLIHKSFAILRNGMRLVFKPYESAVDQNEYTAVVSRHTMTNNPSMEVMQVHVQRYGKTFTTFSFTDNLGERTLKDIPMFDKHFAYLVKNYQKVEAPAAPRLCPNGAKAIPESDPDDKFISARDSNGQYIVWCPTSDMPPRNINKGQKQAKAVAAAMSEKYGKTFFWCRLMGKVEQKVTTSTAFTSL